MADRSSYPSEQADKFLLRLPDGMRDRIKAAAEASGRSMNAEIVQTLEEKYPEPISIEELRDMIVARFKLMEETRDRAILGELKILADELIERIKQENLANSRL